ncbi:MAG: ATP-binding protein, partial [Thiotrichaceae bacterium]|nr:ATP-binding protein [Thiotrichaceae bacterium]
SIITINAEIKEQEDQQQLIIRIEDQGTGIAETEVDNLFEKFVQSNNPDNDTGMGGTGLGLAICKEIISLHKGKIWFESNAGCGSIFIFHIPLKQS